MKRFFASLLIGTLATMGAMARPLRVGDEYSFEQYLEEFNKEYTSAKELIKRKALFEKRVHDIKHHNTHKKASFQKGVNHLTDWTEEEIKGLMGYKPSSVRDDGSGVGSTRKEGKSTVSFHETITTSEARRRLAELPKTVNWVEEGAMTAVKDQGHCGSCWSFSGVEAIESDLFLQTGKLVTLSEQEFVSCMPNPEECGGEGGCKGATQELLFEYAVNKGLVLEDDYPYASGKGQNPVCALEAKQPSAALVGYVRVPTNDYRALLQAVNLKPIAISVDASEFHTYHSGVLDYDSCGSTINHAVLLAGYGTDPELGDYWLVRNSWGPNWGENGYIRLSREKQCQLDLYPLAGSGCKGSPPNVTVCGTCGILYDNSFPVGAYFL